MPSSPQRADVPVDLPPDEGERAKWHPGGHAAEDARPLTVRPAHLAGPHHAASHHAGAHKASRGELTHREGGARERAVVVHARRARPAHARGAAEEAPPVLARLPHVSQGPALAAANGAPLAEPAGVLGLRVGALEAPGWAGWQRACKRTIDLIGAAVGLVLLAPMLLVLCLLIGLDTPGRPTFAHERVGRRGRPFRCFKFRTMYADAESQLRDDPALRAAYVANGYKLPSHDDRRVTALGRTLRLSSLDELPQLWNVLRGEMSLVGPRPVVEDELRHYGPAERALLLSVRPGITGAWAVAGRSCVGYPRRAAIELDYVRRWSLGRDFSILLRTVGAVLDRRGAS